MTLVRSPHFASDCLEGSSGLRCSSPGITLAGTYCASFRVLAGVRPSTAITRTVVASLARATVLEAARNRLLWLASFVIVMAIGLAQFLNQVAITESREIQVALIAALLRVTAVFIAAVFVTTSMVRELEDKVTELLLALPAPRSSYFFGKFTGYAAFALLLAVLCALPLAFFADPAGLALWTSSLLCELLIVSAMSLFCVLSLAQIVPAFAAVAGFYLLSRSMTAMQIIAGASLQAPTTTDRIVSFVVDSIALLLPRLDAMTQTTWLLGAVPGPSAIVHVLAQTAIYLALICAAALFDLHRKNF